MTRPKKPNQERKPGHFQTGTSLKLDRILMQLLDGYCCSMTSDDAVSLSGGLLHAMDTLRIRKKEGW